MPGLNETLTALRGARPSGSALTGDGRLVETTGFSPNPGALRMLVYKPPGLAAGAPLVVALHGCTQTAEAFAAGAGWLDLADRHGFVLLCPEQVRANNANLCFNWFKLEDTAHGAGEVASIARMVEVAIDAHDLDPARIFVTGLSAGGAMTLAMLATYPDVFAAGAPIAGLAYGSAASVQEAFGAMMGNARPSSDPAALVTRATDYQGPWPRVSIWHGDSDMTVKPAAADAIARQWSAVHGLAPLPTEAARSAGREHLVWRSETGAAMVELHRIAGMGHGVPLKAIGDDAVGRAGPFLLDVGVSSSTEIAQWFGLADRTSSQPQAAKRPTSGPATEPSSFRSAPRRLAGPLDVGAVISDALKKAGLLR